MKQLKINKILATMLVATSLLAVAPLQSVYADVAFGGGLVGWVREQNGWAYYDDNTSEKVKGWLKNNNNWFYLDSNGTMLHDVWIQYNGNWYYLNSNGSMATSTWIGSYYVGADGIWNKSNTPSTNVDRHSSSNGSIEGSKVQGGAQDKDLGDALNNGHK